MRECCNLPACRGKNANPPNDVRGNFRRRPRVVAPWIGHGVCVGVGYIRGRRSPRACPAQREHTCSIGRTPAAVSASWRARCGSITAAASPTPPRCKLCLFVPPRQYGLLWSGLTSRNKWISLNLFHCKVFIASFGRFPAVIWSGSLVRPAVSDAACPWSIWKSVVGAVDIVQTWPTVQ